MTKKEIIVQIETDASRANGRVEQVGLNSIDYYLHCHSGETVWSIRFIDRQRHKIVRDDTNKRGRTF